MTILLWILIFFTVIGIAMIIHGNIVRELPGYFELMFGIQMLAVCIVVGWIGVFGFVAYKDTKTILNSTQYTIVQPGNDTVDFILNKNMNMHVISDKFVYVSEPTKAKVVLVKNYDLYGFYLNEHLEVE